MADTSYTVGEDSRYVETEDPIVMNHSTYSDVNDVTGNLAMITQLALLVHFLFSEILDFIVLALILMKKFDFAINILCLIAAKFLTSAIFVLVTRGNTKRNVIWTSARGWLTQAAVLFTIVVVSVLGLSQSLTIFPISVGLFVSFVSNCSCGNDVEAEIVVKFMSVFFNLLLFFQHITIALRISEVIKWSYKQVFWSYWIIIVILGGFTVMVLFLLIWTVVMIVIAWMSRSSVISIAKHAQFLASMTIVCLSISYVFGNYLNVLTAQLDGSEDKNNDKFIRWTYFVVTHNLFYALFFLLFHNKVLQFIRMMISSMEEDNPEHLSENAEPVKEQKKIPKLKKKTQIDNVPTFVKKFTSTYFKMMPKKTTPSPSAASSFSQKEGESTIPKLDMQKASLSICASKAAPDHYTKPKADMLSFSYRMSAERSVQTSNLPSREKDKMNETAFLCNVCFEIESDVVFMECGHGGLCLKCAEDIWKSTGECYLCRQSIDYILRYDNQNRKDDQFKVIEMYQESESRDFTKNIK